MRDIPNFAEIKTERFDGKLILALDEEWLGYFEEEDVKFSVSIKDNRIILTGPKVSSKKLT